LGGAESWRFTSGLLAAGLESGLFGAKAVPIPSEAANRALQSRNALFFLAFCKGFCFQFGKLL